MVLPTFRAGFPPDWVSCVVSSSATGATWRRGSNETLEVSAPALNGSLKSEAMTVYLLSRTVIPALIVWRESSLVSGWGDVRTRRLRSLPRTPKNVKAESRAAPPHRGSHQRELDLWQNWLGQPNR